MKKYVYVNSTRLLVRFQTDKCLKSGKGAVLIVGIGSSAREFMCNAQVKRMSKKKIIQKAGYRVRFEG